MAQNTNTPFKMPNRSNRLPAPPPPPTAPPPPPSPQPSSSEAGPSQAGPSQAGSSQAGTRKRGAISEPAGGPAAKKRIQRWTNDSGRMMLQMAVELVRTGRQADAQRFKAADLGDIARQLQNSGYNFDTRQIRNKLDDLKRMWKEWLAHCGRVSGWGRDDHDVPFADPGVEDSYFTEHTNSKQFRRKAPQFYEECQELFSGNLAAGESAGSTEELRADVGSGGAVGDDEPDDAEFVEIDDSDEDDEPGPSPMMSQETAGFFDTPTPIRTPTLRASQSSVASEPPPAPNPAVRAQRAPSATRSHHREDQSTVALNRSVSTNAQAMIQLANAQILESVLTRATSRLSNAAFVRNLETRRRIDLLRSLNRDGNADIVLGLPDEDLEPFVMALLESMAPPAFGGVGNFAGHGGHGGGGGGGGGQSGGPGGFGYGPYVGEGSGGFGGGQGHQGSYNG